MQLPEGEQREGLVSSRLCSVPPLLQNAGLQGGTKDTSSGGAAHSSSSSSLASWGERELHLLVAHFPGCPLPNPAGLEQSERQWVVGRRDMFVNAENNEMTLQEL